MSYDVFISYRHARKEEVLVLCEHLRRADLSYYRDEERRDDDASIQRGIEQGLADSKLLLAWYDPTYLQSKACAWELSRALVAAHATGAGLQRIVCVDPTRRFAHVAPEALADQARLVSLEDAASVVAILRERCARFEQPLGTIVAGSAAAWYERDRPTHPTWVGRGGDLIRLFDLLDRGRLALYGGQRAPVAVTGWGGEGKTMFVEQYALRFATAYPGGVVWLSGAARELTAGHERSWQVRLESALDHVARGKLGITVEALLHRLVDPVQRIRKLKDAIDSVLGQRAALAPAQIAPYLWIIDDLPDGLDANEQRLWLPPNDQAHCIATLREGAGVDAVFHPLLLPPLEETQALEILTRRRAPGSEDELADARRIVEAVGRLPLALELSAALVESFGYRRHHEVLDESGTAMLERLVVAMGTVLPTGHERSIVSTFLRSIDKLPPDDDRASIEERASWVVLRLAALIAPVPLPDAFAARVLHVMLGVPRVQSQSLQEIALAILRRAAIIRRDGAPAPDCSSMHALLARTVLEARLEPQRAALLDAAIVAGNDWLEEQKDGPPVGVDRRVLAVMLPLTRFGSSIEAAAIANDAGHLAARIGRLQDARLLFETSVAVRASLLGAEHTATLVSMHNLANTMLQQGDPAEAQQLQERVLAARRRVSGEGHPDTLAALSNLAATALTRGDIPGARAMQEQALAWSDRVQGAEHPITLTCMNNLAATLRAQHDLPGARALLERVLAVRRNALGEQDQDTLISMDNLASVMRAQGDVSPAWALREEMFDTSRRVLGDDHAITLTVMYNVASDLRDDGDRAGARKLLEQVLAGRRRTLGERHPDTLTTMVQLGTLKEMMGDPSGARALYDEVIDGTWTATDPLLKALVAMIKLAFAMKAHGDLPGARSLHERVLAVSLQVLGEEHPNTLIAMDNLASTMMAQGDLADARELRERVLAVRWRALGESDPATLVAMNRLALTLHAQRDLVEARRLQERLLALSRAVLGPENPDTLVFMINLAATLHAEGDTSGAQALTDEVLQIRSRTPSVSTRPTRLACLNGRSRRTAARSRLEQASKPA